MPGGGNGFRLLARRLGRGSVGRVQIILIFVLLGPRGATGGRPLGARMALGLGLGPPLDAVGSSSGDDLGLSNLLRPRSNLGSLSSRITSFLIHVGARDPRGVWDQDVALVGVICAPLGELFL